MKPSYGVTQVTAVVHSAGEAVVCYILSEDAFRALVKDHHAIAIKLLTNLGSELGRRLRRANAMISELEG